MNSVSLHVSPELSGLVDLTYRRPMISQCFGGTTDNPKDWDETALYFQLMEDEWCIGDSGYVGEPGKVVTAKDEHPSRT